MDPEVSLIKAVVRVSGFKGYLFTGKLVKTLVLRSNPDLSKFFEPSKAGPPKLIHISPLFRLDGNDVRCEYSFVECRGGLMAKCDGEPSIVSLDGVYGFYLGFHRDVASYSEVLSNLVNNIQGCFEFMNQKVCTEPLEFEYVDAVAAGRRLAGEVLETGGVKIVFSSPVMLRDPLKPMGKFKSFTPTPMNVFATPIYSLLYARGLYSVKRFRLELLRLHRIFNETYTLFKSLRLKWVYYNLKPEPALTGFVNYRLNRDYLGFLREKGVVVEEWLGSILAYTIALGVGAGRATGFGHVSIKPLGKGEKKTREA